MLATSLTTCAAFAACAFTPIWDISCFGVVNGVMVLCDYLLVITWLPAAIIIYEKYMVCCCPFCSPSKIIGLLPCCKSAGPKTAPAPVAKEAPPSDSDESKAGEAGETAVESTGVAEQGRWLERFFEGPFADFIIAFRFQILAVFGVLFLASTGTWIALLKADSEATAMFGEDHFYTQTMDIKSKEFGISSGGGWPIMCTMHFGLDDAEPWETDGAHPAEIGAGDSAGKALYAQQDVSIDAFSTACAAFHAKLDELGETPTASYDCWTDDFISWADRRGIDYASATGATLVGYVTEWRDDPGSGGWANVTGMDEDGRYQENTGFLIDGDRISFSFGSFTSLMDATNPNDFSFDIMWRVHDALELSLAAAEKASGLSGGIQSCLFYDWWVRASQSRRGQIRHGRVPPPHPTPPKRTAHTHARTRARAHARTRTQPAHNPHTPTK